MTPEEHIAWRCAPSHAPPGWVEAAKELPAARRELETIVERIERDAGSASARSPISRRCSRRRRRADARRRRPPAPSPRDVSLASHADLAREPADRPAPRRARGVGARPGGRLGRGARDGDGLGARPARRARLARLGGRARDRGPGRCARRPLADARRRGPPRLRPRGRAAPRARARRHARSGAPPRGGDPAPDLRGRGGRRRPRRLAGARRRRHGARRRLGRGNARRGGERRGGPPRPRQPRDAPRRRALHARRRRRGRGGDRAGRRAGDRRELAAAAGLEPACRRGADGRGARRVARRVSRDWAIAGSTGDVDVCIVDSGIEAGHPLVGELASAVPSTRDGDEIAIVDDDMGDVCGHGTACAGIVRSIAPGCRLHSVRVLGAGATGPGTSSSRACAMRSSRAPGDQPQPLDDEAPLRGGAPRARGRRVLQPDA